MHTAAMPPSERQRFENLSDCSLEEVQRLCRTVAHRGATGRLADIQLLTSIYRDCGSLFLSVVKWMTSCLLVALALPSRIITAAILISLTLLGVWVTTTRMNEFLALYIPNYSSIVTLGAMTTTVVTLSWFKGRMVYIAICRLFWLVVHTVETTLITISALLLWGGFIIILVYLLSEERLGGVGLLFGFWLSSRDRPEATNRWLYWLYFPYPALPAVREGSRLYRFSSLFFGVLRAVLYLLIFTLILVALWNGITRFLFENDQELLAIVFVLLMVWRTAAVGQLYEKPSPWMSSLKTESIQLHKTILCKYTCYIAFRHCQWRHYTETLRWRPAQGVCRRCLRRFRRQSTGFRTVLAWGCPNCRSDTYCQARIKTIDICLDRQMLQDRLDENGRLVIRALRFSSNNFFPEGPSLSTNSWFFEFDQLTVGKVYWGDVECFLLGCSEKGKMPWSSFANTPCYLQQDHTASPADLVRLGAAYYLGCQLHNL